ncbi:MAG: hypothetical protein KKC71_06180 [Chloroflexi bacterium]|nr:hypothetical protein [Chloroflexota bacterium]
MPASGFGKNILRQAQLFARAARSAVKSQRIQARDPVHVQKIRREREGGGGGLRRRGGEGWGEVALPGAGGQACTERSERASQRKWDQKVENQFADRPSAEHTTLLILLHPEK